MVRESLLGGNAYRLFTEELARHLQYAAGYFELESAPDATVLQQLSANFHTIKGSSGFFGFDEIYRLSAELEKGLLGSAQEISESWPSFRKAFSSLTEQASHIPAPVQRGP